MYFSLKFKNFYLFINFLYSVENPMFFLFDMHILWNTLMMW